MNDIDWIVKVIKKEGAWALYRPDPVGGTVIGRIARGAEIGYARKLEAACLQAIFDQASNSLSVTVRNFRKAMRS